MTDTVIVTVSDPWELTLPAGSGGRRGRVLEQRGDELLIELDEPVSYGGVEYRRFVATPGGGDKVGMRGIPAGADVPDPFSPDWWRGGLALIAELTRRTG